MISRILQASQRKFLRVSVVLLTLSTPLAAEEKAHGDKSGAHGDKSAAHGDHAINFYYGLLGEKADLDHPTVLYRTPGMPIPLGSYVFNSAILFFLLYRFGKKPVVDGLQQRRKRIMQGMEEAGKMKADAEAQLAEYEAKLDGIEREVVRIRSEMREAAEVERTQVLAEASKRSERMDQEAKLLIAQELKAAREKLYSDTVRSAMETAQALLTKQASAADHTRLSDESLASLGRDLMNSQGGRA